MCDMRPEYLAAEELEYELAIRTQLVVEHDEQWPPFGQLSRKLQIEKLTGFQATDWHPPPGINYETEIGECIQISRKLMLDIAFAPNNQAKISASRLTHYVNRLKRVDSKIRTMSEEVIEELHSIYNGHRLVPTQYYDQSSFYETHMAGLSAQENEKEMKWLKTAGIKCLHYQIESVVKHLYSVILTTNDSEQTLRLRLQQAIQSTVWPKKWFHRTLQSRQITQIIIRETERKLSSQQQLQSCAEINHTCEHSVDNSTPIETGHPSQSLPDGEINQSIPFDDTENELKLTEKESSKQDTYTNTSNTESLSDDIVERNQQQIKFFGVPRQSEEERPPPKPPDMAILVTDEIITHSVNHSTNFNANTTKEKFNDSIENRLTIFYRTKRNTSIFDSQTPDCNGISVTPTPKCVRQNATIAPRRLAQNKGRLGSEYRMCRWASDTLSI